MKGINKMLFIFLFISTFACINRNKKVEETLSISQNAKNEDILKKIQLL
jgi:hypothetical protein